MIKKNDDETQVNFKDYGCKEDVLGSDHRPVYLHFEVDLKLKHLLDLNKFISQNEPEQGFGKLRLKHFEVQFTNEAMITTKKKFVFPLFLQLKFCGEFLTANPCSFEKRLLSISESQPQKLWKDH